MTDTIVFTRGVPPPEAFPTDQLAACFDAALRGDTAVVLQYGQQPGYAPLRRLLAERVRRDRARGHDRRRLAPAPGSGLGAPDHGQARRC